MNYYDEYSIQLYIGEKRSGKTLSMVAETYENIVKVNPNIKVYANLHLNEKYFTNFQYITRDQLAEFYKNKDEYKGCVFLIDEIHIFLDSRKFMDKGSQKIGYFIGQMGKRGNILKGTTHFPRLCDYRLRLYCERWVYIKKGLQINKNKWKPILNNNKILSNKENKQLRILNTPVIRKLVNFDFEYINDPPFYVHAKDYFDFYETEELIHSD